MRMMTIMGLLLLVSVLPVSAQTGIYGIEVEDIEDGVHKLDRYRGKVLLIVNVASECGYTYQYEGLQALFERYGDDGLMVLGFPSNDFAGQEPGTNMQIQEFCEVNYGVTFPLFGKIRVTGGDMHPLYRYLTSSPAHPDFTGRITWNFNKFLVDPSGQVVDRFGSRDEPESVRVVTAIERELMKLKEDS